MKSAKISGSIQAAFYLTFSRDNFELLSFQKKSSLLTGHMDDKMLFSNILTIFLSSNKIFSSPVQQNHILEIMGICSACQLDCKEKCYGMETKKIKKYLDTFCSHCVQC